MGIIEPSNAAVTTGTSAPPRAAENEDLAGTARRFDLLQPNGGLEWSNPNYMFPHDMPDVPSQTAQLYAGFAGLGDLVEIDAHTLENLYRETYNTIQREGASALLQLNIPNGYESWLQETGLNHKYAGDATVGVELLRDPVKPDMGFGPGRFPTMPMMPISPRPWVEPEGPRPGTATPFIPETGSITPEMMEYLQGTSWRHQQP
jgi:hypothetical protein